MFSFMISKMIFPPNVDNNKKTKSLLKMNTKELYVGEGSKPEIVLTNQFSIDHVGDDHDV